MSKVFNCYEGGHDPVVVGSNALVQSPEPDVPLPPDTLIGVDPMLAALANNGGPTRTHAVLPGSPAIDAGSNPQALKFDQRGQGFPRMAGVAPDVGAYEFDPDRVFWCDFE